MSVVVVRRFDDHFPKAPKHSEVYSADAGAEHRDHCPLNQTTHFFKSILQPVNLIDTPIFVFLEGVVWELLGAGAECSPVSDNGWTPLLAAAVGGHSEVARQLIGAGARITEKTSKQWNALHMASQAGHIGMNDNTTVFVRVNSFY